MKSFISISFFIFLSISIYSQSTYSKLYNPMGYGTSGLRIVNNGIDNYTFYSTSKDQLTGFYINKQVLVTNLFGNSSDTNTIFIKNHNMYGINKVLNSRHGFIFSGTTAYSSLGVGFIIFTDSNFNKINQKIHGDTLALTNTTIIFDDACILENNNEMMFSGQENDTTKQPQDLDIMLMKTDSLGNKIWKKNYSYKMTDRGWFIESTPDGGAIIGGNSYYGASLQGTVRSYDATVLKVDSAGNEQWHKVWGNPNLNDDWAVVQNSGDGNFIVGTAYAERDTIMNDYADKSHRTINIIKLNNGGAELWNKKYLKAERSRTLSRMLVLNNGNIACVGRYRDFENFQYSTSWILMLNSNGDSLWYKEYIYAALSDGSDNILRDIKPTPDGGYICCGEFSDGLNGIPQSLWVLKLDSTGWYYGMGFGDSAPLSHLRKFKVFPNPTSDFITVDISGICQQKNLSLHISNAELKVLEIIEFLGKQNIKVNLQNYPAGIYFIRLQNGSEILGVEKVVVQ